MQPINTPPTQLIPGPAGKLEIIVESPTAATARSAFAVICHPHPLYGGTMHNKVVTTLSRTLQQLGLTTVRFNFRGIGASTGEYGEGQGELEDCLAVIAWMHEHYPDFSLWLAGFSFGGAIAAQAATRTACAYLITVAPAVEYVSMQTLPSILCPWILIQGEKDEVISPESVYQFAATRDPAPTVIRLPEATHYFHGQLLVLRDKLLACIEAKESRN